MKPQNVRLWDIFVIGPVLMYTGLQYTDLPDPLRAFLFGSGLGTTLYNGYNYMRAQEEINRQQAIVCPQPLKL